VRPPARIRRRPIGPPTGKPAQASPHRLLHPLLRRTPECAWGLFVVSSKSCGSSWP